MRARLNHARGVHATATACVAAVNSLMFSDSVLAASPPPPLAHASHASLRSLSRIIRESHDFYYASRTDCGGVADDSPLVASADHSLSGGGAVPPAPVPIIARLIALPERAGTVSVLDVLPPSLLSLLGDDLSSLILPPDPRTAHRSHTHAPGDEREYHALICRMHAAGMVDFSETPPLCVNGVFAVSKDNGAAQRLIMDGRPANARMRPPPWFALPTPDVLATLQPAHADSPLYVATCDVSNYFHMLRVPAAWSQWFGLPPVDAAAVGLSGAPGTRRVWPRCTTLPMGWSFSALIAQQCHEHIIDTAGIPRSLFVAPGNDVCIDRTRLAIYIDDVSFIGHDLDSVTRLQLTYEAVMAGRCLPTKSSKRVAPSADGVEIVGVVLDGRTHRLALSAPKRRRLVADTTALIGRGHASGDEVARIVGRWTWAALARRPSLSAFSSVYAFSRLGGVFSDLWPSVVRELRIVCGLAPLLFASLSAPWSPLALATDASFFGQGVALARVAATDATAIVADAAITEAHRRLLRATHGEEWCEPTLHDRYFSSPASAVVATSDWRVVVSARWRFHSPINDLEARAVKTALLHARSRPAADGCRLLLFSDSSVVCAALSRGRSSAPSIISAIRSIAGLQLASGITLHVQWLPSACNPADGASRGANGSGGTAPSGCTPQFPVAARSGMGPLYSQLL